MVRPSFPAEKKESRKVAVARYVWSVVAAAMGCFLGCFRIKDSRPNNPMSSPELMVSRKKNVLPSSYLEDSFQKGGKGWCPLTQEDEIKELKNEAKFLKACGTLLETPVEIRKASRKWVGTLAQNEELSNFNSWLPSASIEELKLEKQLDEYLSPAKICEECVTGAGSLTDTSSSGDSIIAIQSNDIQNVITSSDVPDNENHLSAISSVSPGVFAAPSVQCKDKSVRFKCRTDTSTLSPERTIQHPKESGSAGTSCVSKPSPYPTPLKLTDEMQTPGTVFLAYLNNMAGGRTNRIRSQYVYSVVNPIEYPNQLKESKDENSNPNNLSEFVEPKDETTNLISRKSSEDNLEGKGESSLSFWIRPHTTIQNANNEQFDPISGENVHCGRIPDGRPILGVVAAHWNDDDISQISPKWWNGNGIPNSTTKYKEDQKVSWHASPFEERLEKALHGDTYISQRKSISGTPPVEFNETEESDTPSSNKQSPALSTVSL